VERDTSFDTGVTKSETGAMRNAADSSSEDAFALFCENLNVKNVTI
jgi:hypothetical protein